MIALIFLGGATGWLNARAVWPDLPIWSYALLALVDTHLTTACVTLYLHRCQTHRSITFNPVVAHLMRFWLWVRTAMPTQECRHCCHHAHDGPDDPHGRRLRAWRRVPRTSLITPPRGGRSPSSRKARRTTWSSAGCMPHQPARSVVTLAPTHCCSAWGSGVAGRDGLDSVLCRHVITAWHCGAIAI